MYDVREGLYGTVQGAANPVFYIEETGPATRAEQRVNLTCTVLPSFGRKYVRTSRRPLTRKLPRRGFLVG